MSKKKIALYAAIAVIPIVVGGLLAVYDIWRESTLYVKTVDAQVTGAVVPAQSLVSGRVTHFAVGVGDTVRQGDVVASVSTAPTGAAGAAQPGLALPGRFTVQIRAPAGGTVVSRPLTEGAGISGGQTLLSIADLERLWVLANIDESRIGRVRPGQPAEVKVEAAGTVIMGEVAEITPATSTAVSGGAPAGSAAAAVRGGAARTIPMVPVRVAITVPNGVMLFPGMSAEVKIRVQ